MAEKKSDSLRVQDLEKWLELCLSYRGRFLRIAAVLVVSVLSVSYAHANFTPTRFQESLSGCAFEYNCDTVYGPSFSVPYSVEFDYEDDPPGDDFFAVHSKAQTNGGFAPAVDVALDFSAWSHGPSLDGIAQASIEYQLRVNYKGGETPPTTAIPLIMTYHLETRMQAGGFGNAESYANLTLSGPGIGTEQIDEVGASYSWYFGLHRGGRASGGVMRLLEAGPEYVLRLNAYATVSLSPGAAGGGMSALIVAAGDPYIEFAPDFQYADDYEIVIEPGSLQNNPEFQWSPMPAVPCEGDFEPDGDVDGLDLDIFITAYAIGNLTADLDNSGVVDTNDLEIFAAEFGRTDCP